MGYCFRKKLLILFLFVPFASLYSYVNQVYLYQDDIYLPLADEYIGYPTNWADSRIDLMMANDPSTRSSMPTFVRWGTPFNF